MTLQWLVDNKNTVFLGLAMLVGFIAGGIAGVLILPSLVGFHKPVSFILMGMVGAGLGVYYALNLFAPRDKTQGEKSHATPTAKGVSDCDKPEEVYIWDEAIP